jgi:rRNA processing protein Krr1/Pno1
MGKSITLERLLIKGIETYNEKYTSVDYDKKIKIIGYFKTVNMLINDNKILKRIISKDATASVYQNLVKILGAKNDYLKKVNLDSKNT